MADTAENVEQQVAATEAEQSGQESKTPDPLGMSDADFMDFDLISVDENMMRLRFDQIYYVDINEDGNKEAIAYNNDFTLEK